MENQKVASVELEPIQPTERILEIDILRGFALLGILMVNIWLYSHPLQIIFLPKEYIFTRLDHWADWFIHFFAESKFYSLFSFLFGLGFSIQLLRATERGTSFLGKYLRRLLILLIFGLLHAIFVWVGDILSIYAILGLVLILFRKAKPKTLLVWIIVLLGLAMIFQLFGTFLYQFGINHPVLSAQVRQSLAESRARYLTQIAGAFQVYGQGTFGAITRQRLVDFRLGATNNVTSSLNIFVMFLIGFYFGRRRIFQEIENHLGFFKRLLVWCGLIGIGLNVIYATVGADLSPLNLDYSFFFVSCCRVIGAPALSLFFVASITLLCRRTLWKKILRYLAAAGRMALSNYLFQSIIFTLIFYGYGLRYFGQLNRAASLLITVIFWLLQLCLSRLWFKWFRYGPFEWIWRSLTYWKCQHLRNAQ
jgi:uncharacterized protein